MPTPSFAYRVLVIAALVLCLTGCAALFGYSIEALMKQGIELLTQGKYDEALARFQEVLKRDPQYWNAYLYMARAYIGKQAWTDALASARKAFDLAPAKTDVIPVLGEALLGGGRDALQRGQFAEAAGLLRDYVKLRPTDFQAYLELARALAGSGAYREALGALTEALSRDSGARQQLAPALLEIGRQALAAGDAKSAIGLLREYVRQDGGNAAAYAALGKAYWQNGDLADALGAFQRVLQLDPSDTEALRFIRGAR
jgi:tetratricopeptide (TPR) repeat protein